MASGAIAYTRPSSSSGVVRQLGARTQVTLVGEVQGENWVVGDQGWVYNDQGWTRTWYQLDDGSYVYRAFVFLPDSTNLPIAHNGSGERYVIVDLGAQTAYAMEGTTVVREMPVTTGKDGFTTPTGTFHVLAGGRFENTRMTSRGAGITDPTEQYDVQNVLFTQYFRSGGFALHMNYWQPNGVFGNTPTSHGCVGLELPDAQFLWHFGYTGMRVVVRDSGGATPVAPPEPTATPKPAGPPPVEIFATQGGEPGAEAVAAAKTTPGTTCTLNYVSTSGSRRELPDLAPQAADALGWLEFKWRIPPDEAPGVASVEVTCPGGATTAEVQVT